MDLNALWFGGAVDSDFAVGNFVVGPSTGYSAVGKYAVSYFPYWNSLMSGQFSVEHFAVRTFRHV